MTGARHELGHPGRRSLLVPAPVPPSPAVSGLFHFAPGPPASASGASERRGLSVPLPLASHHARTHSQSDATGTHRRARLTWRWRGVGWRQGGARSGAPGSGVLLGSSQGTRPQLSELDAPVPPGGCHLQLQQPCTAPSADPVVHFQVSDSDPGLPCSPQPGQHCPQPPTEAESLFCGWPEAPGVQMVDRDSLAPDVNAVLSAPEGAHSSHMLLGPGRPVLPSILARLRLPTRYTRGTYLECACAHTQSCPTLHDPKDCSPPGTSVHGICQARILEWVAISSPRGSSQA